MRRLVLLSNFFLVALVMEMPLVFAQIQTNQTRSLAWPDLPDFRENRRESNSAPKHVAAADPYKEWRYNHNDVVKLCDPETVQGFQMMAMMGGNSIGSGAYYRYLDKVLDGFYVNNALKEVSPDDAAKGVTKVKRNMILQDTVMKMKQYVLVNCSG